MPVSEKQETRAYGFDQDYPGSYRWPRVEVVCPVCGKWVKEYGLVSQVEDDGTYQHLCVPCGEAVMADCTSDLPGVQGMTTVS